jgi:hypothetical protein
MRGAKDSEWHEGQCFCGAVRYRVRGDAVWKAGCTCNTCVRMHAAPYVVWAGFDRTDYQLTAGEPVAFRSSPHVVREFCPACGTTLTYGKESRGNAELEEAACIIYVAVASLDDPGAYPPDEVVHARERIGWFQPGGDIPVHEFVSPQAGRLQFGGIDQARAAELAKHHFDQSDDGED